MAILTENKVSGSFVLKHETENGVALVFISVVEFAIARRVSAQWVFSSQHAKMTLAEKA